MTLPLILHHPEQSEPFLMSFLSLLQFSLEVILVVTTHQVIQVHFLILLQNVDQLIMVSPQNDLSDVWFRVGVSCGILHNCHILLNWSHSSFQEWRCLLAFNGNWFINASNSLDEVL